VLWIQTRRSGGVILWSGTIYSRRAEIPEEK
jgi:hypothetical protein